MRKKVLFGSLIIIFFVLLYYIIINYSNFNKDSNDWTGEYYFEDYVSSDIVRIYSITIYEADGLYADIKIDGFQILKRLRAKAYDNSDEIILQFHDHYADEKGNISPYGYNPGDVLLKFQRQKNELITVWGELQPMAFEEFKNAPSGQYFFKRD